MKKFLVIICFYFSYFSFSQNPSQVSELRHTFQQLQVLSPSPEMRNMIRFDNVEVSPYTGTPDINIPLFAFECTKDLNFSMSLKYHPDAIKRNERAGSTGLGWSLFAGGSITRVVRGLPDDSTSGSEKIAIGLNIAGNRIHGNDLDDFINNQSTVVGSVDGYTIYDKMFEALESGHYDTQHDLYYYNFMGYSGSFYIRMNNSGQLSIIKLEENSLKISATREDFIQGDPNDPNRNKISNFTIYDDLGNKYLFNVKESSSTSMGYKVKKMFGNGGVEELGDISDGQNSRRFTTAYHLSSVTPYRYTEPILTFTYEDYLESYKDITHIKNKLISTDFSKTDEDYYQYVRDKVNDAVSWGWVNIRRQFGNSESTYHNTINVSTKKLKRINYNNKIYIDLTYEEGRSDKNYFISNLVKLSNIQIMSADPPLSIIRPSLRNIKLIKQFKLNYVQTYKVDNKLLLKDVIEYKTNINDELVKKYRLYYNSENSDLPNLFEDEWGYCTNVNPEGSNSNYTTNSNYIKTFVLEKMEVPTGGCIIYNYEPHSYSYIGSNPLYSNDTPLNRRNEIGGGIRIKNIGFFDDKNVPQNYYTQNLNSPLPAKESTYSYELAGENLSSGSLSFPKPVFKYNRVYDLFGDYGRTLGRDNNNDVIYDVQYLDPSGYEKFFYQTNTNYNNLHTLTTNGANVGYKNVTITERNNGRKVFTFTSPIDFPEQNYTISYPFMPSKNVDYKRGLVLNEKNYNSDNILISEIDNTYDYVENEVNIGIIPFYAHGYNCRKTICNPQGWIKAELINTNFINCHNGFDYLEDKNDYYNNLVNCTSTAELMNYNIEKRVVGWAKLSKSERIDYLPNAMNNVTEYSYNPINKKPGLVKNIIGSDVYSTEYQYLNVSTTGGGLNFDNLYNRISDVKKATAKFNNEVLATENILFKDVNPANSGGGFTLVGSEMYVPEKYQYAKGTNALEDIQTITRMDDRGNPLEVKKADGTFTTFIWGHNKTRLVAVIENCQFSEIEGLAAYTSIVSNTNNNLTATVKTNLLNHYGTLRSSLSAKSLMTALIHDIGLGVVTKIDPNGKVVNYNYSNLGNLEEVRDNGNNLLKQYFEFYKN